MINPDAFPLPAYVNTVGEHVPASHGMSLRDWFAGQAMGAQISAGYKDALPGIAIRAYQLADAMLTERAKS